MDKIYYRYESTCYNTHVSIGIEEYKVIKETAKGVWIANLFYDGEYFKWKKFIRLAAKKKWAHDNKQDALNSFIKRKERQLVILEQQTRNAKAALNLARLGLVTQSELLI